MIEFLKSVTSTQNELISRIKSGKISSKYAIVADFQTSGFGSRGNFWQSENGNLFLSFCVAENELVSDLPMQSVSLYFALLMQEFLNKNGSKVWLKWPNDFYINDKKCGGILTQKVEKFFVVGVGMNLISSPLNAEILDIKISRNDLIYGFLNECKKEISWKQIFSKLLIEFKKSQNFNANIDGEKVPLKDAILCEDGSILINNKKVYSLR